MIVPIGNAPVKFLGSDEVAHNDLVNCSCRGQNFSQLVECGDTTSFQVNLTPVTGDEEILNGDFDTAANWTFGTDWSYDAGNKRAVHAPGAASGLSQNTLVTTGAYVKLIFTIGGRTAGSLRPLLGTTDLGAIDTNGTFTLYGFFDTNSILSFGALGTFDGWVDDVSMVELSQVAFGIKDTNTDQFVFLDTTNANVQYVEEKAQVNFDWSNLAVGYACENICAQICLFDLAVTSLGSELVTNGTFDVDADWVKNAWTIGGGVATLAGAVSTLEQAALAIVDGKPYRTQFEVVTFAGAATGVTLGVGGTTGTPRGATGVYIEDLATVGTANLIIDGDASGPSTIEVDNVSVKELINSAAEIIAGDVEPVFCSENYELKNEWDCSFLLTWTNDEDAFGFNYTDFVFQQSLRVRAKLKNALYSKPNKDVFVDSEGNRDIIFSQTVKKEELIISEMPEYLHDALSIGIEHDEFAIDGIVYINEEDEYSPNWRKSSLLAPITLEMIKDGQFLENNNC